MTPLLARIALLLTVFVTVAGCGMVRTSDPADLTTVLGCAYVRPVLTFEDQADVLEVSVRDCDQPSPNAGNADRIAGTIWRSLRSPVDRVDVTLAHPTTLTTTIAFHGEDLAQRYQIDTLPRTPRTIGAMLSDLLWLLLPASYLAVFVLMVVAVRRLRRAGIVLFVFRS